MKDWCYVDIPGWSDYQEGLQKFITKNVQHKQTVYNFISQAEFKLNCAELTQLIETYFEVELERIIVFNITKEKLDQYLGDKSIHIDSGSQAVRLNWPVLNPHSVVTKYFKITDNTYQPKRQVLNPPFGDYIEIYDLSACEETSSVCIDRPTIFSVNKTAHSAFAADPSAGEQWPRIICSFNFKDDTNLVKYLQKDPDNH